jgi:hypothetical protein
MRISTNRDAMLKAPVFGIENVHLVIVPAGEP